MGLVVQKYGGTSVKDPERIQEVAKRIYQRRKDGDQVVVVVSAMAGETNRLIALASSLSANPTQRELDAVVSTGEQVTSGLLAIALNQLGCPALSVQGHQIRIVTDSRFTNARIQEVKTQRMEQFLRDGFVIVVAGFQGTDDDGSITTLGRGGSDLSAIAVAHALGADVCELYKDVDGIFTADPRICPQARKLDKISYEEMLEMSSQGAKVLQTRAVEMAAKYAVPVLVRNSYNENPGTLVCEEDPSMEQAVVSGITSNTNEAKISIRRVPDRPGTAGDVFECLAREGIVVDMIIQNASADGFTDMTFTVPKSDLERALSAVQGISRAVGAGNVEFDSNICKVSAIGVGMRTHTGVASRMFRSLAAEGINIQLISTSEIKISCVIEAKYSELAVRTLHDAFGLEQESRGC